MNPLQERLVSEQRRRSYKKALLLVVCLLAFVFCSAILASATGKTTTESNSSLLTDGSNATPDTLELGENNFTAEILNSTDNKYPNEQYDYLLWRDNLNYYARNGTTGEIEYSGTSLTPIIESIVARSSDGLFLCFKKGVYILS